MKIIKSFLEYIKELNHQTPDYLNVNSPGYGQGAHYSDEWGINYGKQGGNVRNTFGDKGDKDKHIPTLNKGDNFTGKNMYFNPETNTYLDDNELKELIRNYKLWCTQNQEDPIDLNDLNSKTIGWIYKKINN